MEVQGLHRALIHVLLLLFLASLTFAATPSARTASNCPFGVMLGGPGMTVKDQIAVAKSLGITYIRPSQVTVDGWKGSDPEIDAFQKAGYKIILTVRNNGAYGPPPGWTVPPVDMSFYKKTMGSILDKCRPSLLIVENEENSPQYYQGTVAQYAAQLKAACDVAHSKGIKCTNGGLVSSFVAAMVWSHYREQGDNARADDFAKRVFTTEQARTLQDPRGRTRVAEFVAAGKEFLKVYKESGVDYVNFHWYIPDAKAFAETVEYLRSETGLQPITNEIGLFNGNPEMTGQLMAAIADLKLPYAVWFSLDVPGYTALQTSYGTLRPNGDVFKAFIQERYGKRPTVPVIKPKEKKH